MENLNIMFALITGMAISVSLALLLEKAVFTSVMKMMVATPMMAQRGKRSLAPPTGKVLVSNRAIGSSSHRAI